MSPKPGLNLNAKAEEPALWSYVVAAHKVMRDRNYLSSQLEAARRLEADTNDTLELIGLAEAAWR